MKKRKWILGVAIVGLLAILLAGCSAASPATDDAAAPEIAVAEEAPVIEVAEEPTAVPAEAVAEESTMESDDMPDDAPPAPRSGLEATDPSTVALASGSYQLVEFFAFW